MPDLASRAVDGGGPGKGTGKEVAAPALQLGSQHQAELGRIDRFAARKNLGGPEQRVSAKRKTPGLDNARPRPAPGKDETAGGAFQNRPEGLGGIGPRSTPGAVERGVKPEMPGERNTGGGNQIQQAAFEHQRGAGTSNQPRRSRTAGGGEHKTGEEREESEKRYSAGTRGPRTGNSAARRFRRGFYPRPNPSARKKFRTPAPGRRSTHKRRSGDSNAKEL